MIPCRLRWRCRSGVALGRTGSSGATGSGDAVASSARGRCRTGSSTRIHRGVADFNWMPPLPNRPTGLLSGIYPGTVRTTRSAFTPSLGALRGVVRQRERENDRYPSDCESVVAPSSGRCCDTGPGVTTEGVWGSARSPTGISRIAIESRRIRLGSRTTPLRPRSRRARAGRSGRVRPRCA